MAWYDYKRSEHWQFVAHLNRMRGNLAEQKRFAGLTMIEQDAEIYAYWNKVKGI